MIFWDSSAIIPLCIDEPNTKTVQQILKKDGVMAVWWGSSVECYSAFSRLRREGHLKSDAEDRVRHLLAMLADAWIEIEPSNNIKDIAERLLRIYPLHAADALQLASALIWAEQRPKGHQFLCFDAKLSDAAKKEGFVVLPSS